MNATASLATRVPRHPNAASGSSFVPLFATLAGGAASVTIILFLTLAANPAVGVILGCAAMVLFVLVGMQRLLDNEGPDQD